MSSWEISAEEALAARSAGRAGSASSFSSRKSAASTKSKSSSITGSSSSNKLSSPSSKLTSSSSSLVQRSSNKRITKTATDNSKNVLIGPSIQNTTVLIAPQDSHNAIIVGTPPILPVPPPILPVPPPVLPALPPVFAASETLGYAVTEMSATTATATTTITTTTTTGASAGYAAPVTASMSSGNIIIPAAPTIVAVPPFQQIPTQAPLGLLLFFGFAAAASVLLTSLKASKQ
ncbi:hypothetical protein CEUSTIGMA_g6793.t1 [Chlamydomonas eustigma]|uniref:Uncharacterized protein n=1 Tax=Chlamydomonas eustigma TaxID=1157962 RepID=A0A250X8E0_9CHLO|nr:hypothetical protein CEUSTIGMA_g6793.t1 [Chlamydomonas eustigma]|eukprot:GAX79351.1 hypothetical protein CEUSTIGMA_g6793.t1 [Chlamydomonas eustigma]